MKQARRIALTLISRNLIGIRRSQLSSGKASAGNWPQWRGPDGSGISNEKNLPSEWSPTKNIKWKTPIDGRAHSSPIVWGNKVFLTTAVEGAEVPGAKAVKHELGRQRVCSSGQRRREQETYFQSDCPGSRFRQDRFGNRLHGKARLTTIVTERVPTPHRRPQPTARWSMRSSAQKVSTLTTSKANSRGKRRSETSQLSAWEPQHRRSSSTISSSCRLTKTMETASFIVALDKKTGKEVWKTPRKDPGELVHSFACAHSEHAPN